MAGKHLTRVFDGHNNVIGRHTTENLPTIGNNNGVLSVNTGENTMTHYKDWGKLEYTLLEDAEDND